MLLLLGGPSGSGKTTVANILQEKHGFSRLVTVTTRPPREGEKNGVDYYFVSIDEFRSMQATGRCLSRPSMLAIGTGRNVPRSWTH